MMSGGVVFNHLSVKDQMFGDFLLVLLSKKSQSISTAALSKVESSHNGTTLSCASTISAPSPNKMAAITLLVQGIY